MAVRDEVISRYRSALETEIGLVADLMKELPDIARPHRGGGTPSILGLDGLRSALAVLGSRFRHFRRKWPMRLDLAQWEHADRKVSPFRLRPDLLSVVLRGLRVFT
jgi:hypothetical protein